VRFASISNRGAVGLGIVLLAIAFAVWHRDPTRSVLPDRTVLRLTRIDIGRTNGHPHAGVLSKAFANIIPSNGLSLGEWRLERPHQFIGQNVLSDMLCVELFLSSGSKREKEFRSPPIPGQFRLMISGDDDFAFVTPFYGFNQYEDGLFAHLWSRNYPREAVWLHLRLEERDKAESQDWHEVASFAAKNPKPIIAQQWKAEDSPRVELAPGLIVEAGELVVRHGPPDRRDIAAYTAVLPIRIWQDGNTTNNWKVTRGAVEDAEGNRDEGHWESNRTNGWIVSEIGHPLDPAHPWKFDLTIGCGAACPKTNYVSLLAPFPLPPVLETNCAGVALRLITVNGIQPTVYVTRHPATVTANYLGMTDTNGRPWELEFNLGGRTVSAPRRRQVLVHVAVYSEYEAEFTLQPRLERTGHR